MIETDWKCPEDHTIFFDKGYFIKIAISLIRNISLKNVWGVKLSKNVLRRVKLSK